MTEPRHQLRLLVGVGQADVVSRPRLYLEKLLRGLGPMGIEVQVALRADGPVRTVLEPLADVRVLEPDEKRGVAGVAKSAAGRLSRRVADRTFETRTARDRAWIREPDGIHLHGALAVDLLRYLPASTAPVTTYLHPWDFRVAGLPRADRDLLIERTVRFVVPESRDDADSTVIVDELVSLGVGSGSVVTAADPLRFPSVEVMAPGVRAAIRSRLGVADHERVVAVLPVPDWVDCPDLTLGVAWELQRLGSDRSPTVLWIGMPDSGDRRWPIDYDIARMGLTNVRLSAEDPTWHDLVGAADAILLPVRTSREPPREYHTDAAYAALRGRPVLCWEGHPATAALHTWRGTVVARGDVSAMASSLWSMLADSTALAAARHVGWSFNTADVERLLPFEVPAP